MKFITLKKEIRGKYFFINNYFGWQPAEVEGIPPDLGWINP